MNLGELRSQLKNRLAEAGSGAFSVEELNAALNRSQNQLAEQNGLLEKMGRVEVDLHGYLIMPGDFLGFSHENLFIGDYEQPLTRMTLAEAALIRDDLPFPVAYVWDAGFLGEDMDGPAVTVQIFPSKVWPGEVKFGYHARPTQMVEDTDRPWSGRWQDWTDIISLNAARLLQAEQGPSAAGNAVWYQNLQSRLAEFHEAVIRSKGTYRMQFVNPRGRGGWTGRYGYYRYPRRRED